MKGFGKMTLAVAGILVGALLLNPVAAHVNDSFSHLWNDHIKPKADTRYVKKTQSPWAAVEADGGLALSKGVSATQKNDTGDYTILFNRNVLNCATTATSEDSNLIAQVYETTNPKAVSLYFVNTANNPVDTKFNVIVRC
jgi:hypothetical protein